MNPDVLRQFNELPAAAAIQALYQCCSAPSWAERMAAGRPYCSPQDAIRQSSLIVASLSMSDLAQALADHPRIGGRPAAADAPGRAAEWSRQEQALVSSADAETSRDLASANLEYEQRFGHIYLVCASGRTAKQLLTLLRSRLHNDARAEWQVVRSELQKINEIRLRQLLAGPR